MGDLQQRIRTTLEVAYQEEIQGVLNEKLKATSPERVCDYVGFASQNLEDSISKLKQYKRDIDVMIKKAESQKEMIGIEVAKYLNDAGISKLDGTIISSITTRLPAPTVKLVIDDEEEALKQFGKLSIDKTALKNALSVAGDHIQCAYLEVVNNEETIRINKRK